MANEAESNTRANEANAAPSCVARNLPPLWYWLLLVVLAGLNIWSRTPDLLDHAIANLIAMGSVAVAVVAYIGWFAAGSGHRRGARWVPLGAVIGGLAIFFAFFRIDHFTAELLPVFRSRLAGVPDEQLANGASLGAGGVSVPLDATTDDDFPQFLGPNRDLAIDRIALARDWQAQPPRLIWRHAIGAGHSAFSAVNGYAVTMEQRGEDELVTCYDVLTGDLKWANGIKARHSQLFGGIGPRSTPTIQGGKVYALGATGVFRCLDSSGSTVWSKSLLEETNTPPGDDASQILWGHAGSPLIVDNMVVVPGGGPISGPRISLLAFDKLTGKKLWQAGDRQISYSSPSLARLGGVRQILIVNEDSVTGHNAATGSVLWSYPWPGSSSSSASASQAVPVGDDRAFISKGYTGGAALFAVKQEPSGKQQPARADEPVYDWTTTTVWHHQKNLQTKMTNVVVYKGFVFGLSDGILECVELNSGKRQWKSGRYGHGQILRVRDLLLVATDDGEIVLVELTPDAHHELGRFQAIDGQSWNNLCLYRRYLLVRNSGEAACYELPLAK
jgi:outer membrane protein assembly factor BamB